MTRLMVDSALQQWGMIYISVRVEPNALLFYLFQLYYFFLLISVASFLMLGCNNPVMVRASVGLHDLPA